LQVECGRVGGGCVKPHPSGPARLGNGTIVRSTGSQPAPLGAGRRRLEQTRTTPPPGQRPVGRTSWRGIGAQAPALVACVLLVLSDNSVVGHASKTTKQVVVVALSFSPHYSGPLRIARSLPEDGAPRRETPSAPVRFKGNGARRDGRRGRSVGGRLRSPRGRRAAEAGSAWSSF
jgi:hypothetical protein